MSKLVIIFFVVVIVCVTIAYAVMRIIRVPDSVLEDNDTPPKNSKPSRRRSQKKKSVQ